MSTHRQHLADTGPHLSPFHQAVLEVVTRIGDAEFARGSWDDYPPVVWGIDKNGLLPLGRRILTAWELPLDREIWRDSDGAHVLEALADYLAEYVARSGAGPPDLGRRQVCAVALAAEAWTLNFPPGASAEERMEAHAFAERRGIPDHPWGVEAKTVMAVGTDGWRYNVIRLRSSGDGPTYAEPANGGITGRYADALDTLLQAIRPLS